MSGLTDHTSKNSVFTDLDIQRFNRVKNKTPENIYQDAILSLISAVKKLDFVVMNLKEDWQERLLIQMKEITEAYEIQKEVYAPKIDLPM